MALTTVEESQTRELLAQQAAILSLADSEATIISKLGATKVNLSQLPSATSLADADLMLVRQGTTDKSGAFSLIKSWFNVATVSNDPTFADDSARPASTGWVRGAMLSIATAAGFSVSKALNGYIKFPSWLGGIIFQWGNLTATTTTTSTTSNATLPIAFPTGSLLAVISKKTDVNNSATPITDSSCVISSTTVISIAHVRTSGSIVNYWAYFVIGY